MTEMSSAPLLTSRAGSEGREGSSDANMATASVAPPRDREQLRLHGLESPGATPVAQQFSQDSAKSPSAGAKVNRE